MEIIYRACSIGNPNKNRPIKDRFELIKTCFRSFENAFRGVDCNVTILLDKPTNEYRGLFSAYKREETFYTSFDEGNTRSFHRQIDLALQAKKPFFFIEDDYFFLPGTGKILYEAAKETFVTPYDHPGYYLEKEHDYPRHVRLIGGQHFASIISTTLTFGGSYESLRKEADTMRSYGWADHHMWCDITKRRTLYSPIPSLATHMEIEHLAPGIDWKFI